MIDNDFDISDRDITEDTIHMHAKFLYDVDQEIKRLNADKIQSEKVLRELLNHDKNHDGQISYTSRDKKITITTGYNHKIDAKKYLQYRDLLDAAFNPVIEKIEYKIVPDVLRQSFLNASDDQKIILSLFITSKEKKMHVSVKNNKKEV